MWATFNRKTTVTPSISLSIHLLSIRQSFDMSVCHLPHFTSSPLSLSGFITSLHFIPLCPWLTHIPQSQWSTQGSSKTRALRHMTAIICQTSRAVRLSVCALTCCMSLRSGEILQWFYFIMVLQYGDVMGLSSLCHWIHTMLVISYQLQNKP